MSKTIKIVLVGQPNVGKTALINALCHTNLKIGNFAGVTVDITKAVVNYKNYKIEITDLPGIYSLNGYTKEEKISKIYLENEDYDIILNVTDSTNLQRNLMLTTEIMLNNKKMVLALNMSDEAKKESVDINVSQLQELLGIESLLISADKKTNLNELLELVIKVYEEPFRQNKLFFSDILQNEISKIANFLDQKSDYNIKNLNFSTTQIAQKLLMQDDKIYAFLHDKAIFTELTHMIKDSLESLYSKYDTKNTDDIFMQDTYAFVNGIIAECVTYKNTQTKKRKNPDDILINKYFGIPIFLFFMWVLFQLTFTLGAIPMDYIEAGFTWLGEFIKENITNEIIASALADGVIGGVGAVIMFLPNIMILFFGIALLETTGYMARVAFLLDGFFHKFGLHGKSFIPLVTGFGCSVPAFMAARTLKNEKDRLLTLFIINFMSCGARLPVYVLFIGVFAPKEQAGNWLFAIYIFGAILGLIAAKILRLTAFKGPDEPFVMEMPKYRIPNWRLVWFMIWNKAKMYLKKAGTFILAASLLIWFASSYPKNENIIDSFDKKIEQVSDENIKESLQNKLSKELIENSYLGRVGYSIEPIFSPLGFDWRLGVSLLSGLAAKEVMISTMGVLYSLGDDQNEESADLMIAIRENIPLNVAIAYLLFVMFYNPCLAATVVFYRESGKFKYVVYLFIFTTFVAYIMSFLGSKIFLMLG